MPTVIAAVATLFGLTLSFSSLVRASQNAESIAGQNLSETAHAADIPATCVNASTAETLATLDAGLSSGFTPALLMTGSADDLVAAFDGQGVHMPMDYMWPWLLEDSPRDEVSFAAWRIQLEGAQDLLKILFLVDPSTPPAAASRNLHQDLARAAGETWTYSETSLALTKDRIKALEQSWNPFGDLSGFAEKHAAELCLRYPSWRCSAGLKRAVAIMNTVGDQSYSMHSLPDVFLELLTDPVYRRALPQYALLVMDRIAAGDAGSSDVYTDLIAIFEQLGESSQEARDRTMKVLGAYGSRGASFYIAYNYADPENYPVIEALTVFSAGMGVLDHLQLENGAPLYSYPTSVDTRCLFGRPYHFWLPAYLAYRLQLEGYTRYTGMMTGYVLALGYEMFSPTFGRDPGIVFTRPSKDPLNNGTRMNLAFGGAGARFGAYLGSRAALPTVEIDRNLGLLLQFAGNLKPITMKEAQALSPLDYYLRFSQEFTPDFALTP